MKLVLQTTPYSGTGQVIDRDNGAIVEIFTANEGFVQILRKIGRLLTYVGATFETEQIPEGQKFQVGQKVVSLDAPVKKTDWMPGARDGSKPGMVGRISAAHNAHGEWYDVTHEDGTVGRYDYFELIKVADQDDEGLIIGEKDV